MLSFTNRVNKLVIKIYYSQFDMLVHLTMVYYFFFVSNGILFTSFLLNKYYDVNSLKKNYDVNLRVHYLYT